VRPKLWTILFVSLISAVVWCSARVRVSAPPPDASDALSLRMLPDAEAPSDVRLMDARARARHAVGWELLAGRLTVPEAAAVFGWLDRQHPALSTSMIEAANRAMAGGSPVGAELMAIAKHEGEWLCLRTVGYARNLALGECPECAEELAAVLDDRLKREWKSALALPAVDEASCRTMLLRVRAGSRFDTSGLRLVNRERN
jgi:hypothetical protein